MIKKKAGTVLIIAMIIMSSLTACQNTEDEAGQNAKQEEEAMEEITDEKEVSGTEQGTGALLAFLTDSPEYKASAEWLDFNNGYDIDFTILE